MASKRIDNCVSIESDVLSVQKVTSYTNLHKWPMAEVEFVKSISHGNSQHRTMVMNNISCRQMYLRSYTFTRKENKDEGGCKTGDQWNRGEKKRSAEATKKGMRKNSKATPCTPFVLRLLWKCFSCTSSTKVNIDP